VDTVKPTLVGIMPRIQPVVIQILREYLPLKDVHVGSWVEDVDYREFPLLNVRRIGGGRDYVYPNKLDVTVIELTAYSVEGLVECEHLYNVALEALYDAVLTQKQTDTGYLHSINENMGMTQFSSLFMDSWRVQGLLKLGLRPKSDLS
jgi:hypothetical protein